MSGATTFTQLAVSVNATCGRTSGGVLYCWGSSGYGLYGDGVQGTVRLIPSIVSASGQTYTSIALGPNHACAIASNGAAQCWGQGTSGQLGDNTYVTRSAPSTVGDGRTYTSISAGASHSCGVTTSGAAFCWGYGGNGEKGDGFNASSSVPVAVGGGLLFTSVSAASQYTCGRATTGVAYCWGLNNSGQIGDGTQTARSLPTAVLGSMTFAKVTTRGATVCGRITAGQPYCWGYGGYYGSIGDGAFTDRLTPSAVSWIQGTPGLAVSLVLSAGNNQSATRGTNVGTPPSVIVKDFAGAPVAGVTVTFAVSSGGGSLTGATAVTNASGVATLGSWTLGVAAGSNTLTASAPGLPTVIFTASGI